MRWPARPFEAPPRWRDASYRALPPTRADPARLGRLPARACGAGARGSVRPQAGLRGGGLRPARVRCMVKDLLALDRPVTLVVVGGRSSAAGAGAQLRRPEMVADAVRRFLDDDGRLTTMRERAWLAGRPRAALDIVADILRDLERASDVVRHQSGALPARNFTAQLLEDVRCDRAC